MYTKNQFGNELKKRVAEKQDISVIGHWAYSVYLEHIEDINDDNFDQLLLVLNSMEDGPEFAFTYAELSKIADDLIAGKDVQI